VARLKAEYTAQRYRQRGSVPLAAWMTGHIRKLNALGSAAPGFANWMARSGAGRWVAQRVMGIDRRRPLPEFSTSLYKQWRGGERSDHPRVALFGDCFTVYNEAHIGLAAKRVLERLGYSVILPRHGCCGRSMISVGMLPEAIATIDGTVERLRPLVDDPSVRAVLFIEPSCLSAVKDDWLQLKCRSPRALRERLAAKAMLVEQFIEAEWTRHPSPPAPVDADRLERAALHAHCHQKALWGAASSGSVLKRLLGDRLTTLQTGCCGMAGSFGYDKDKFDLSMAIANLPAHQGGVMKAIKEAEREGPVQLCATGTSCRHQIADASGGTRTALHPVELIDRLLQLTPEA